MSICQYLNNSCKLNRQNITFKKDVVFTVYITERANTKTDILKSINGANNQFIRV